MGYDPYSHVRHSDEIDRLRRELDAALERGRHYDRRKAMEQLRCELETLSPAEIAMGLTPVAPLAFPTMHTTWTTTTTTTTTEPVVMPAAPSMELALARVVEAAQPSAVATAPAREPLRVYCQSQFDPDD